jgi:hypothetical protein
MLAYYYRRIIKAVRSDLVENRIRFSFYVATIFYNITEAGFRGTGLAWVIFLMVCVIEMEGSSQGSEKSNNGINMISQVFGQ